MVVEVQPRRILVSCILGGEMDNYLYSAETSILSWVAFDYNNDFKTLMPGGES